MGIVHKSLALNIVLFPLFYDDIVEKDLDILTPFQMGRGTLHLLSGGFPYSQRFCCSHVGQLLPIVRRREALCVAFYGVRIF